ncbi:MAG: hypothetical protein F6K65_06410 [Moorea sp. SIO3C2]|nr:hypothetical protein [Moorena sp. SIO3C2]NES80780.1 hypothetical protein [Moorena sp. SIO2B7]
MARILGSLNFPRHLGRGLVDAKLMLRDIKSPAIAATTTEPAIEFFPTICDYFKILVIQRAFTGFTATTELWTISFEVSDSANGTFTEIGKKELNGTAKDHEIAFTGNEIYDILKDSKWMRATATKTGTSVGNLTYGAFIVW